ncbi:MAG: SMP-30/Gluconolaconase/LRE-like region-containing protein [Bacteroidetes bacterium]|nr:SMP-30/Gluconolaconase/LRE-like region-containing protein [Bacteroidota bacterium]
MKRTIASRILLPGPLISALLMLNQCSPAPEWKQKNDELITQYSLAGRELTGLPRTKVISNLEAGKVTSLESITGTELYPGVNAKLYWGQGTMAAILRLEPNAQIPEEVLPADRFLFVLEGEVNQLIDGSNVKMTAVKREEQDGTHSITPRIDLVYMIYTSFSLQNLQQAHIQG